MVIKGFEERNYMKYPVYEYKYFHRFDLKQKQSNIKNVNQSEID